MSHHIHHRALESALAVLHRMTKSEFKAGMAELCERGLLTCTHGRPGDDDATYALGWLPLADPAQFPAGIRERHAANMLKLRTGGHA